MSYILPSQTLPDIATCVSDDVLFLILSQLDASSRPSLLRAALVCKRWRAFAQPLINRTLDLILSPGDYDSNIRLFQRLRDDASFLKMVREICVRDWLGSGLEPRSWAKIEESAWFSRGIWPEDGSRNENTWVQFQQLIELIPQLSLTRFTWSANPRMPGGLIDCLNTYQPGCYLEISLRADASGLPYLYITSLETKQSLERLVSSSCLVSLGVTISVHERNQFRQLQQVVRSCPRLQSLAVYAVGKVATAHEFQRVSECPWVPPSSDSGILNAFPALRALELHNFCMCEGSQEHWSRLLDWSRLTHAAFTCASFLVALDNRLADLRCLRLELGSRLRPHGRCPGEWDVSDGMKGKGEEAVEDTRRFLFASRGLVQLDLTNCTRAIDESMLSHLGRTITSLRIHEFQAFQGFCLRPVPSEALLQQLGLLCPRLRYLEIDVAYQGALPYHTFDIIAEHLLNICHLALNFEICYMAVDIDPPATLSVVRDIWDRLRARNHVLEVLVVSVGSQISPDRVLTEFQGDQWERSRRLTFEARDGVAVRCVELDRAARRIREEPSRARVLRMVESNIREWAEHGPIERLPPERRERRRRR